MAYQIDKFNKEPLTIIQDGTIDQTTDLKLIGRYFRGYGEIQNENFLYLLENFAGETTPPKPVVGQIWFDATNRSLKYYDGFEWRTTSGTDVGSSQPNGQNIGDLWWNTEVLQLFAFDGNEYVLVGPDRSDPGETRIEGRLILGLDGIYHPTIITFIPSSSESTVGEVVTITSEDQFEIDLGVEVDLDGRFSSIKSGTNLANTDNTGVSRYDFLYWGTASSALGLVVDDQFVSAEDFVLKGTDSPTQFDGEVNVNSRLLIGGDGTASEFEMDGDALKISSNNPIGDSAIQFFVTDDGIELGIFEITVDGLFPMAGRTSLDIGSESRKLDQVYAQQFNGVATSAKYADLAEKYTSGIEYPVGTIMAVCTHGEHDMCPSGPNDIAIGVISENPGFVMNDDCPGQAVGLKGRVPIRVVGVVSKGDPVYSLENGIGSITQTRSLVGIALESSENMGEKLVECVLKV